MYKLLLVDDEVDVREGVVQEVDWLSLGFQVVATAENGKEAAELLEKLKPDVLVTDIRMPFMNGLELSEMIRSTYPTTKIIILTGFEEFEYAQRAIRLQIDEYLLKPFSSQEFVNVLRKVKHQIDEEMAARENAEILKEHYEKSLPVLQQVFLSSLIARKLPEREIESKSLAYHLSLEGKGFVVSVIRVDALPEEEGGIAADKALQQFAVYNIAEEIAAKYDRIHTFIHNEDVILFTVSPYANREQVLNETLSTVEFIRQCVEKYLKCTVTIGIGSVATRVTDVKYSYESASQALDYRPVLGHNRTICIDDVETRTNSEPVRFDELKQQALIRCIKVGTMVELSDMIEEMFRELTEANGMVKDNHVYLLELIASILRVAKDTDVRLDTVFGPEANLFARIDRFQDLEEAKRWMYDVSSKMMMHIVSNRQSTQKKLIEKAKGYVKQYYSDPDLSIQLLCGELHISAGYFSSIFKKETRVTFVAYLQQVRMEAAKESLRSTELKTFEIAEQVGYTDPNYFSFSFKKLFGISPKEYRNGTRGNTDG
jgi:two-component system response regulator YesN